MGNKKVPYLCGGTLFFLLVQAKKLRSKAREREKGVSDGLKDTDMMEGLLKAVAGSPGFAYEASLKKNTSQFRECKIDGSTYIPFNNPATASGYNREVTDNYGAALSRMNEFAESFLNPAKTEWLVRVLLDVIDRDAGIGEDARFRVLRGETFLSKSEVLSEIQFELQPFLVGIVHYILMNRKDNTAGRDTLNAWGIKPDKYSERRLREDFSLGSSRTVKVDWYKPDKGECPETIENVNNDRDSDSKCMEAEIVNKDTEEPEKNRTSPLNQTVFINNGSGIQIGTNYGPVNLPLRGEKDQD